jgi:DNA ligase 1
MCFAKLPEPSLSVIWDEYFLSPKLQLVIDMPTDEITCSPTQTAGKVGAEPGYELRFLCLVSFWERDKKPEDATTVQELIELYNSQGKK